MIPFAYKIYFFQDNKLTLIAPHVVLDSKAFRRSYANKIEVYEVNDLSTHPTTSAPCINVQVQDSSMYASQWSQRRRYQFENSILFIF